MITEIKDPEGHLTGYGSRPYRTYVLLVLLLVYTLNFVDRNLIGVVGTSIIGEFGLTDSQYGLLTSWPFAIFYAIMGLPIAIAADRFNRVRLMAFCIILWSIMTALCGLAAGFLSLLAFRVGVAVGEAGCTPPANSLIADYFKPSSRGTAIGIYSMGVTLGSVMAFLLGGTLAGIDGVTFGQGLTDFGLGAIANQFNWQDIPSWRIAFVVVGMPGVFVALLMWLTVKEPPRGYSDPPQKGAILRSSFVETIKEVRGKPSFWWNTIAASFVAFVGYGLFFFQNIFLERVHGLSTMDASVQFGVPLALFAAFGTFFGGWVSDKVSRFSFTAIAWIPALGLFISIPFYLVAFWSDDLTLAFWFWAVAAVTHYGYLGAQFNITQGIVNNRSRATAIAIMLIVVSIFGNGLGPQFVGIMSDVFTSGAMVDGLTLADCPTKVTPGVLLPVECSEARAIGTRLSMSVTVVIFSLASICFLVCCKYLRKDWVAGDLS